jgi:hypothetical protein
LILLGVPPDIRGRIARWRHPALRNLSIDELGIERVGPSNPVVSSNDRSKLGRDPPAARIIALPQEA